MKSTIVLAACLALPLSCAVLPASAAAVSEIAAAATDFSAKKQARKKRQTVRRAPPPVEYRAGFRAFGADPSFDPYGRPYRPPSYLSCPVDLGYGRWTSCDRDN